MSKSHTPFNVIIQDFNRREFEAYDVMPYFINEWKVQKKSKSSSKELPTNLEALKEWIKKKSMYQFWSRCEYEVILCGWPNRETERKIDVYWQIMLNLDLVTRIFAENIKFKQ